MERWLRVLGALVLGLGLAVAAVAGWLVVGDEHFQEAAAAYARHPGHTLFQTEYWAAAARHYGLLAAAVAGVLGGLVVGGLLLGLGETLRRLPRR